MPKNILREITPLTQNDFFTLTSRVKSRFDFPLHYHEELELNFIQNGKGGRRIVGDHIGEIEDLELVLLGSNLQHAWLTHRSTSKEIRVTTIHFHKDLFDERFLRRNQLSFLRNLLEKASRGILFSKETTRKMAKKISALNQKKGFESVLGFMLILHELSIARNRQVLSDSTFNTRDQFTYNSRRIEKTYEFINKNFKRPISLKEVANLANMSEASFSRFFKSHTGITFIDSLTEIRLGHASRLLIDTTQSVAEIAYNCGFNNISNFNRIFRKKKNCTPKEFRESYSV
jgi:AraC-like DNA-binding protein